MPLRLIMFTSLSRRVSSLGSVYCNLQVVITEGTVFGSDVVNLVLLMSGVWLCGVWLCILPWSVSFVDDTCCVSLFIFLRFHCVDPIAIRMPLEFWYGMCLHLLWCYAPPFDMFNVFVVDTWLPLTLVSRSLMAMLYLCLVHSVILISLTILAVVYGVCWLS